MSVIIGIVKRQGAAVEKSEADALYETSKGIAHHSHREVLQRNAAFCSLHTQGGELPCYMPEEGLLFTAQGRLDNRSEVCRLLELESSLYDTLSDESLILRLYLKWRDKAPEKLLGDWSFAAYDFEKDQLFLAQDPFGTTSLYYYIDDEVVIFSNLIKPLVRSARVPKTLDFDRIIEREAKLRTGERGATVYEAIKLLGSAHRMWVDGASDHKERYWFPEKLPQRHAISAEEAAMELKTVFTEAVRCRLHGEKPVASMLSGGLDSGSVSAMAGELLKTEGTKLHSFSHVPFFEIHDDTRGRYTFGDERPNIEATVAHNGNITPHYLDSAGMSPLEAIRALVNIADQPMPIVMNSYWLLDMFTQVRDGGFGTLLSGQMGNATLSWGGALHGLNALQLLKRRGLKAVLRHKVYNPLMLGYIKPLIKSLLGEDDWTQYCYLSPEIAKKIKLKALLRQSGRVGRYQDRLRPPRELQLDLLKVGYAPQLFSGALFSYHFGIEYSDPTADKRVVEFILQMPNEVFIGAGGEQKQLLKLMMKELLPKSVLYDKRNGKQSADIMERIQADIPEIGSIIRSFGTTLCDEELFDKPRLLADLERLKEKRLGFQQIHFLLSTIVTMEFLNHHKNLAA